MKESNYSVSDVPVGSLVTCLDAVDAVQSLSNGLPYVVFKPGMVGRVACVDAPYHLPESPSFFENCGRHRGASYCCVDFFVGNVWDPNDLDNLFRWRTRIDYHNMRILELPQNGVVESKVGVNPPWTQLDVVSRYGLEKIKFDFETDFSPTWVDAVKKGEYFE